MLYVLYIIFFVSCIALVGSVLLQPGKTDAGALFTSNVSSASLGPRGTASVLSKITIAAATTFMIAALLISLPALSGDTSVLGTNPDEAEQVITPAAADTDAETGPDANADANSADMSAPAANAEEAGIEQAPPANVETPANN